jgi:hypothetical protein
MANEKIALLKKSGATPKVKVTIGRAQWGSFGVYVTAKDGLTWEVERKGHSWDSVDSEVDLGLPPAQLDGRDLWIDLVITPLVVGDPYSATIEIRQGGEPVTGGVLPPYKGVTDRHNFMLSALVRLLAK